MAKGSTLYRFQIEVSDVDRGFYGPLDFRAAMHPSENEDYLITRVLAYALNYEDGLTFSPGLSTNDEPAIYIPGQNGKIAKWIDIGNPAPRRLHKAAKAADAVRVYTYKDPENLIRECKGEQVHRSDEIEVFSLPSSFLKSMAQVLERDNIWGLIHNEGELTVTRGEESWATTLGTHRLN